VPVGDWLKGDRVTELGRRLLANEGIRRWFDTRRIPELVAAERQGHRGNRELWGLMQFAIWHRLFVEQPGLRPAPDEDPLDWVASDA
jgi:asparagine synthase (glutamine-hydrolysing)